MKKGVASALYEEGERLVADLGGDTLKNWGDPKNDHIIAFLQKRGYSVLNLIELRRPYPGEKFSGKIAVGSNKFDSS